MAVKTTTTYGYCRNCMFNDDIFRCYYDFFGGTKEMPCKHWKNSESIQAG